MKGRDYKLDAEEIMDNMVFKIEVIFGEGCCIKNYMLYSEQYSMQPLKFLGIPTYMAVLYKENLFKFIMGSIAVWRVTRMFTSA